MTVADTPFISPIQRAHPGGFFWTVNRARRIQAILDVAGRVKKLVVIAGSESEACDVSERLTLLGLPVLLASKPRHSYRSARFEASARSAIVTTSEFASQNGPVQAPITIHLRPPFSSRNYVKRLRSSVSAVHLTFVIPEDEQRASTLRSALSPDLDGLSNDVIDLDDVIDLTTADHVASIEPARRRFAFRNENSS